MQHFVVALALVAAVMAAPQPEVARALKARQVGGGLGGFVPGASGFLSGTVPASGAPFGCIGGTVEEGGSTICAREAKRTPAPEGVRAVKARQVGGGLGGFVPSASGFLSGTVPASGIPFGCIGGGIIGPKGVTICAREAAPTPAPQIGGGLGGFVPGAEGTITGDVPANAEPTGFLSGSAGGESATLAGRQVDGGLGGFVPSASGFLSGTVPASGVPYGCIGGGILGPQGVTICAREAEATPAPEVVERQIGGGFGGAVPGASGTATGDVPANGMPTGLIGGILGNGEGATLFGRAAEPTPVN